MAKVTISEQDNTLLETITGTENIVYIPGYTKKGEVNTPTLINSYAEFIDKFGEEPFIYESAETYGNIEIKKGDYEKSWIYATQLLQDGVSILFERVGIVEELEKAEYPFSLKYDGETVSTASLVVKAKTAGTHGNNISISISESLETSGVYNIVIKEDNVEESFSVVINPEENNHIIDVLNTSTIIEVDPASTLEEEGETTDYSKFTIGETSEAYLVSGLDNSFTDIMQYLSGTFDESGTILDSPFDKLSDKLLYDVKFITSGGYPNVYKNGGLYDGTIGKKMLRAAAGRGDALALIDFQKGLDSNEYLGIVEDVFGNKETINGVDINTHGTLLAPNCELYVNTINDDVWMPSSFVYLRGLISSIRSNPIWYPVAGAKRGIVSGLKDIEFEVGETIKNSWQDGLQCINPIMNVRPYGYIIFGQRTLLKNDDINNISYLSYTNIRLLINEVKKVVSNTSLGLMFESNDVLLWNTFRTRIRPTLDRMKNNRGLTDYKIIRTPTTKKGTVKGLIRLLPIESAENFDITFSIENEEIIVD